MSTIEQIAKAESQIDKLNKALDSKATAENFKPGMRLQISKLQKSITALQQTAETERQTEKQRAIEAEQQAQIARAEAEKAKKQQQEALALQQQAEAEKKALLEKQQEEKQKQQQQAAEAKKKAKKIEQASAEECKKMIAALQKELSEYQQQQAPVASATSKKNKQPVKRTIKASSVVALRIMQPVNQIARREMTEGKVGKINICKLEEAQKHFVAALKSVRLAFGGIADDNSSMLKNFNKEFNQLIKEIKEKQQQVEATEDAKEKKDKAQKQTA